MSWTIDATSGKARPANATEWDALLGRLGIASGGPSAVYLFNEASGAIDDKIGSRDLTASGTLNYSTTIPGWSAVGVKTTRGAAGKMINTTFPEISTNSALVILYARVQRMGGVERTLFRYGDTFDDDFAWDFSTTGKNKIKSATNATTGTRVVDAVIRPYVMRINQTADTVKTFTDLKKENISPTFSAAASGTELCFGGDNVQTWFPGTAVYVYAAVFTGAAAEMTDEQIDRLLEAMGWRIGDVTQDAASGWYTPKDIYEWESLLDGTSYSAPDHLWPMQETSGDFINFHGRQDAADSEGHLVPSGGTQNQTVAGWTRKGWRLADNTAVQANMGSGTGANSAVVCAIFETATPGAQRTLSYINGLKMNIALSGSTFSATNNTTVSGLIDNVAATPNAFALHYKPSATTRADVYTRHERIRATQAALDSSAIYYGGVVQTTSAMDFMYCFAWIGDSGGSSDYFANTMTSSDMAMVMDLLRYGPWRKRNIPRDASSGWYVPRGPGDWKRLLAGTTIAVPDSIYECDEVSGNLRDRGLTCVLEANNAPSYNQTIGGWTRKAVATAEGQANQGFHSTSTHLADPSTTSTFIVAIASIATPGAVSGVLHGSEQLQVRVTGDPKLRITNSTNSADTTDFDSLVHLVWIQQDETANVTRGGDETETVTPTYAAVSSAKRVALGGFDAASADAYYLYAARWEGAGAELSTAQKDQLFNLLQNGPYELRGNEMHGGRAIMSPRITMETGATMVRTSTSAVPVNVSDLVVRPDLVRSPRLFAAKQYLAMVEKLPQFAAPTGSPNELTVYPGKAIVARRHPLMRQAYFGPNLIINNPTVTPVGGAGSGTFAIDIEEGATVTYTWLTDVMKALSGKEQRFGISYRPRQRFEFTTKLTAAKMRSLLSTLVGSAASAPTFLVGLPFEEMTVAAGSAGTVVQVHPGAIAESDWASAGQRVIVVKPDGTFGSSYIISAVGNQVTLFDNLSTYAVENARIMPAVDVLLDPNQPFGQHPKNLTQWDFAAVSIRRAFASGVVGKGATVSTLNGVPVWDVGVGVQSIAQQPMMSGAELLDLGGTVGSIGSFTVPDWGRSVRLASDQRLDWQWLKKFFDTVNGGRVAFLLPTGRDDLVAVGDASSGTLTVQGPPTVDAPDYVNKWFPSLAHRYVRIVLTTGVSHYRQVNSCLDNGNGTQNLVLNAAVAGTIDHVEFAELVRFEGDQLRVTWNSWGFATSFSVRVVQR